MTLDPVGNIILRRRLVGKSFRLEAQKNIFCSFPCAGGNAEAAGPTGEIFLKRFSAPRSSDHLQLDLKGTLTAVTDPKKGAQRGELKFPNRLPIAESQASAGGRE